VSKRKSSKSLTPSPSLFAKTRGKKREAKSAFNDLFLDACRRGFHGTNRTGFLPTRRISQVFFVPLHRDVRKEKDLRLQGLLVFKIDDDDDDDDDDERLPSRTSLQQFILLEPPFCSTATAQLTTEFRSPFS